MGYPLYVDDIGNYYSDPGLRYDTVKQNLSARRTNGTVQVVEFALGGAGTKPNPWFGWETRTPWGPYLDFDFGSGWFTHETPPAVSHQGIRLRGRDAQVLYQGGGPAFVFDGGEENSTLVDVAMSGFSIQGGAVGLYLRSTHHSNFRLKVRSVSDAALRCEFGVCNTYNLRCSLNEDPFDWANPPVNGIVLTRRGPGENSTASTIDMPIIEAVTGDGIVLDYCSTIKVNRGTSESNGGCGLRTTENCSNIEVDGLDMEANRDGDLRVGGADGIFRGILSDSWVRVSGYRNHFHGGLVNNVELSGGAFNNFRDVSMRIGGAASQFIDNALATGIQDCFDFGTMTYMANKTFNDQHEFRAANGTLLMTLTPAGVKFWVPVL